MIKFYDKQGMQISEDEHFVLFFKPNYKTVAKDLINGYLISTVWAGIKSSEEETTSPLIFETMVFKEGDWTDLYKKCYANEEDALAGHKWFVENLNEIIEDKHGMA